MERITRRRAGIFLAIFTVIICLFALRLYAMQIIQTGGQVDNTKTFTTITRVKAARGDILDRNGNVLVSNRASYDLVFNHYVILSADGTNDHLLALVKLCKELEVSYYDHFPVTMEEPFEYTLSDYNSTWQSYFQSYLPTRGGLDSDISAPLLIQKLRDSYRLPEEWTDEEARAVIGLRYELDLRQGITNLPNYIFIEDASSTSLSAILELNTPGLKTEASTVREYSTPYAAHILGYVGPMTKDQWAYYGKLEDQVYSMDAHVGQSGFELAFEEYLHGTDGWRVDVTYVDGTLKESYYRTVNGVEQKPVAGKNVEVTIDLNVQRTAEDSLASLITALRNTAVEGEKVDGADAEGGAVVVMNNKTGQVLACASYPTYDPSTYFENYEELLKQDYAPLFNRALQALYPPGSTYKMSMVVAGIDAGAIDYDTKIRDQGVYTKYIDSGFTPKCLAWTMNHSTHGDINAVGALEKSCNYFFYELAERIKLTAMDTTAKQLGLGEPTGIELGERIGHRANAETKAELYTGDDSHWYPADQIMASIGQSDNKFTPMQLCVYTSTLANRGIRYKATFLNRVVSSDYRDLEFENQPKIVSKMTISDEAYQAYTDGMRAAVVSGTAWGTFGRYPIEVAAKTGTAQHTGGTNDSDHGAFVCYAPFDDPEVCIAVYGEKAGHGTTMGQIAKAVMDTYFDNPEVGDVTTNENQVS